MSSRSRVAVRVDATSAIGWGHFKRCLAIAAPLRRQGVRLQWLGRSDASEVAVQVRDAGDEWIELDPDATMPVHDAQACIRHWAKHRPNLALVDHYRLDAHWHRAVRNATGARIAVVDDLANRPLAPDLLIDHNLAADHAAKYRSVLLPGVPMCCGPDHALLGPHYTEHAKAVVRVLPQRVGLVMGATDPQRHAQWALRVLRQQAGWAGNVCVATTSANAGLADLQAALDADGRAELLLDAPHLADFFAGLDLAIVAGGGALWECCCLGVPTVALITVDNHRQSVPPVAAVSAVLGLEAEGQRPEQAQALGQAVRTLLADDGQRQALRQRGMALVDGRGAERVAQRLLKMISRARMRS